MNAISRTIPNLNTVNIAGEAIVVQGQRSYELLQKFERDRVCALHALHHILGLDPDMLGRLYSRMARSIARDALRGADER